MTLSFAMRTADRSPKRNYLGATLRDLHRSGVDVSTVHVCATAPDVRWIDALGFEPRPIVHQPSRKLGANSNGLQAVESALADRADYVVILEDDLEFCADFAGSLSRWLDQHARADRHIYRVFGFAKPSRAGQQSFDAPLEGLRASQTIIMRTEDAADFLKWGRAHLSDWCHLSPWGRKYPQNTNPEIAFDKLVATWALLKWPKVPGVLSWPFFVKHVGDQSSLHSIGVRNDAPFAGESWRYACG